MSDEEALIQEILANPNDANARLIYADWLDERNDPRGAYLRRLCAAVTWDGDPAGQLRDWLPNFERAWVEQMHRGITRAGLARDDAYDPHNKIKLDAGRTIGLRALNQRLTYAGLLEGTPIRDTNDRFNIEPVIVEARGGVANRRVRLIEPQRRDYLQTPGDMGSIKQFGREPEWLPAVTCIGVFGDTYSALAVVWFQEEYALPIEKGILTQIRALDWAREADHWTEDDL
jgi:uncharacterized protein (TIGR02996 family)